MGPTLVVATANAASGLDRRTGRVDVAAWADAAAALAADVLAVQEVDHLLPRTGRTDQTALLAERWGMPGRFAAAVHGEPGSRRTMRPAPSTRAEEPSYGVALFSRHPVRAWHELRMPPSRAVLPVPLPPGAPQRMLVVPDEQRVALAAVLDVDGATLTAITTHLSFAPWHAARQLRTLVRWAAELPRPLVLLGDLNLPGDLPTRVSGWPAALRVLTYPAGRPRTQLDHVLLDRGGAPVRVGAGWSAPLCGADHRALRVQLVLGPDGAR